MPALRLYTFYHTDQNDVYREHNLIFDTIEVRELRPEWPLSPWTARLDEITAHRAPDTNRLVFSDCYTGIPDLED
jgi:hypothetical protein